MPREQDFGIPIDHPIITAGADDNAWVTADHLPPREIARVSYTRSREQRAVPRDPVTPRHPSLPSALRKQPLQERSKIAVQHLLDTAREIVLEQGTEALSGSPTILLERSGISRGSLYAFFESPDRVLDELARRCMVDSYERLTARFASRPKTDWIEIIDILVDHYREQYAIPLIRELWVGQHLTTNILGLDQIWCDEIAQCVFAEFTLHAPHFNRLSHLQCAIGIEIMERLAQYAFRTNAHGDQAVMSESREVLRGYFASFE